MNHKGAAPSVDGLSRIISRGGGADDAKSNKEDGEKGCHLSGGLQYVAVVLELPDCALTIELLLTTAAMRSPRNGL